VIPKLIGSVKEALLIFAVSAVVALSVNHVREGGIPIIADAEAFRVRTDAEFMAAEDAFQLFDAGEAIFIDARDQAIFATRHIEGAMNLPPSREVAQDIASLSAADPQIVVYASRESQRQAGVVADKLLETGFTKVFILHGGLEGWVDRGFPVATSGG
jgi:rhodanese-related sulfurtransferase